MFGCRDLLLFHPAPHSGPRNAEECNDGRQADMGRVGQGVELDERGIRHFCAHLSKDECSVGFLRVDRQHFLDTGLRFFGSSKVLPGQMNWTPKNTKNIGFLSL